MQAHRWWEGEGRERFWLEITDRHDLGVDLNAPQSGRNGREQWHYSLIWEVRPGDVVFHYHRQRGVPAISAWSRAWGEVREDEVVWAPHAGEDRTPLRQPGWRLTLEGFHPLATPVTFDDLQLAESTVRAIELDLSERHGLPLYTPFETGNRAIRPKQAYLTKFPADLVDAFPALREAVQLALTDSAVLVGPEPADASPGEPYRRVDESVLVSESEPFARDPALVERSLRSHAATQNALADFAADRGWLPRSPRAKEPNFDLLWSENDRIVVVEVKSIRPENEERQLRLALGQVLRYRQQLSSHYNGVVAVVAASTRPSDRSWETLLNDFGVFLVWPGAFARLW
jgi:hypothetical protein